MGTGMGTPMSPCHLSVTLGTRTALDPSWEQGWGHWCHLGVTLVSPRGLETGISVASVSLQRLCTLLGTRTRTLVTLQGQRWGPQCHPSATLGTRKALDLLGDRNWDPNVPLVPPQCHPSVTKATRKSLRPLGDRDGDPNITLVPLQCHPGVTKGTGRLQTPPGDRDWDPNVTLVPPQCHQRDWKSALPWGQGWRHWCHLSVTMGTLDPPWGPGQGAW